MRYAARSPLSKVALCHGAPDRQKPSRSSFLTPIQTTKRMWLPVRLCHLMQTPLSLRRSLHIIVWESRFRQQFCERSTRAKTRLIKSDHKNRIRTTYSLITAQQSKPPSKKHAHSDSSRSRLRTFPNNRSSLAVSCSFHA